MFDEDRLKEALNIPAGTRPVAIIPVGHTKSKKKPPSRKPLEDIVYHETF